jgi:hypothetical protein
MTADALNSWQNWCFEPTNFESKMDGLTETLGKIVADLSCQSANCLACL